MNRLFKKIHKKSPKPSQHIAEAPSGPRTELKEGSKGKPSRTNHDGGRCADKTVVPDDNGSKSPGIVFQDKSNEDQRPPTGTPEASATASGGVVGGGSDPTSECFYSPSEPNLNASSH
jgi:hypothetical protein